MECREISFLKIKDSVLHGKGLFAAKKINSSEIIAQIYGELIDADECVQREAAGNVFIFWKSDNEYIDVSNSSCLKYINHSCNYNCIVEEDENGNLLLIASREIQPEEELTIDYGYDEIYLNCACKACSNKSAII